MSLRRRIHGLQKGEDAASLGLPAQAGGVDALVELQRLHRWWCEAGASKSAAHASQVARASIVYGIADLHFFASGGKAFEQPGKTRELTSQEKQDIEVFGRVTERTQSMMVSQHNFAICNIRATTLNSSAASSACVATRSSFARRAERMLCASNSLATTSSASPVTSR